MKCIFKSGDKVRCTKTGEEDEVKFVPGMKEYDRNHFLDAENGMMNVQRTWVHWKDYELIKEVKMVKNNNGYKVGDRVLILESDCKPEFNKGDIVTVIETGESCVNLQDNQKKNTWWFENSMIEMWIEKEEKNILPDKKLSNDDIIGQDLNKRMLNIAIDNDMPVLLIGETGTGKTTIIREQAKARNAQWSRFNLTGETTVDEFVGKYELQGGETVWKDGILLQAMKEGKWLIVDEINVALPEILFVLHSLLDDDKMVVVSNHDSEVIRPHKNFRFFATMNPCDEYAGTKELNKAFQSRFNMILILQYPNKDVETKIVKDKADIDNTKATEIADVAIALRKAKSKDKIYYTCSTRDLIYWGNLIRAGLDIDEAFTVSILNKATSDTKEVETIYQAITGRYLNLTKNIKEELTIEYFEKKFRELDEERKKFEDDKQDLRDKITAEIIKNLTKDKKTKKPAITTEPLF